MKIVIFAGGTGRRLWPISRKVSPKQFEAIIGSRSTVQLAVERVIGRYGAANIFVSTNQRYLGILHEQLPQLPPENLIGEPARRDLAAAVGLALTHVGRESDPDEVVAILWGDNTLTESETFLKILATAEGLLKYGEAKIVFIGETPRFANNNLGWIGLGEQLGVYGDVPYFGFRSWIYRPALDVCQRMLADGGYVWNTGYFVTTVGFVRQMYATYQPELWAKLQVIEAAIGREDYDEVLWAVYPQLAAIHFDDAIAKHVPLEQARVLHEELGWSDPGTLYALKEAINPQPAANVIKGVVLAHASQDCLVYNYEENKLVAVVGLDGMIVVNTDDALLVVHKDHIGLVKEMVDGLVGTELEKYS